MFGHQPRGLNGATIKHKGVPEASLTRCEMMKDTDFTDYNGQVMTWGDLKKYEKAKPSGFCYDDCEDTRESNKERSDKIWEVIGPVYCQKNNVKYVPPEMATIQKIEKPASKNHYIIALDDSGSMSGSPW